MVDHTVTGGIEGNGKWSVQSTGMPRVSGFVLRVPLDVGFPFPSPECWIHTIYCNHQRLRVCYVLTCHIIFVFDFLQSSSMYSHSRDLIEFAAFIDLLYLPTVASNTSVRLAVVWSVSSAKSDNLTGIKVTQCHSFYFTSYLLM